MLRSAHLEGKLSQTVGLSQREMGNFLNWIQSCVDVDHAANESAHNFTWTVSPPLQPIAVRSLRSMLFHPPHPASSRIAWPIRIYLDHFGDQPEVPNPATSRFQVQSCPKSFRSYHSIWSKISLVERRGLQSSEYMVRGPSVFTYTFQMSYVAYEGRSWLVFQFAQASGLIILMARSWEAT